MTTSKNILLVTSEAEPSSQQALAELGGIRVSLVTEVAEPMAAASYDLVVVDDQPSTAEVVARLHDRYPKLPIVALSSGGGWKSAREAWRAGATDVVEKQSGEVDLSQAVKRILGLSERSILFVDDDPEFLATWARLLRDDGYSVAAASSAAEALESIANQRFGLAIVDVRLARPYDREDKSGLRVAEAASQQGITTIILTGHPDIERMRDALRKGRGGLSAAVDFVDKAEGFAALRSRIEAAFEQIEER